MRFNADEKHVKICGRTLFIDGVRYINYSASAVEFRFTGRRCEAVILSDCEGTIEIMSAWIGIIINGGPMRRIKLSRAEETFLLYEGKSPAEVTIKIVKLSEAAFGKVGIKELICDGELSPAPKKPRRLEFVGDSITCGYGIEGVWGVDSFTSAHENPLIAYAVRTAERLDAECNLVSWSGTGVVTSSVAEDVDEADRSWLSRMLYRYTDAGYSNDIGQRPFEKWDFSRFVPDAVIVNLGTNDATWTRGIAERTAEFGRGYYDYIREIRQFNPEAEIVCTLGAMGRELCPEIARQVERLRSEGDKRVHFLEFEVQDERDCIGTDMHPNEVTNIKMADRLSGFLEKLPKAR